MPFRVFIADYVDLHWHEFYELCLVYSGEGINVVNGQRYNIRQGSLFLLTPADFHEVIPTDGNPLKIYNIVFTRKFLSDYIYQLLFQDDRNYNMTLDQPLCSWMTGEFTLAWEEWTNREPGFEVMGRATLERILVKFARACLADEPLPPPSKSAVNLRKAIFYIEHHFREPISLKEAADEVFLSANYFSECFRKHTGVTFQHYLADLRLGFARSLLAVSELSVTEICFVAGFTSLANFERSFKRKYQKSPKEIRGPKTTQKTAASRHNEDRRPPFP